jgi:hypothetical protein
MRSLAGVLFLLAAGAPLFAAGPKIYIVKNHGFENYLIAAMTKKHVPVEIVIKKSEADYVLDSTDQAFTESTGSKIARCLFAYCAGVNGIQTASVSLVKISDDTVVWGYNVKKGSARAYQSTAEAVAKHLKKYLEKHQL